MASFAADVIEPPSTPDYWSVSRRPLVSLVFIFPFLLIYEAGVWLAGVQNGADAWMRRFLDLLGFSQHLLLPLLTIGILLAWHYVRRDPWRFPQWVLGTMAVESLLTAIGLRIILYFQSALFSCVTTGETMQIGHKCTAAVSYLGAGIYEELLFRLIVLSLLIRLFQRGPKASPAAVYGAILLSSILFSAAHHVGAAGEAFLLFPFLFRTIAGVYFSLLFRYRGFGIAAGCHALYDILVGCF